MRFVVQCVHVRDLIELAVANSVPFQADVRQAGGERDCLGAKANLGESKGLL